MEQWRAQLYQNELYHHGILGMRWGKKNGPPYPLDEGDHSSSEKKAGYKKSIGGGRNEELYDRKKTSKSAKSDVKKKSSDIDAAHEKELQEHKKRLSEMSPEERERVAKVAKGILIAAAVVGVSAACVYVYKKHGAEIASALAKKNGAKSLADLQKKNPTLAKDVVKQAMTEAGKDISNALPPNVPIVLKEGHVFKRIDANENFDLQKAGDFLFAACNEQDANVYKAIYQGRDATGKVASKKYQVALKAAKDIIAPNRDETNKIIDDMLKNDPQLKNDILEDIANMVQKNNPYFGHLDKRRQLRIIDQQLFSGDKRHDNAYKVIQALGAGKDGKTAKKIIDEMGKKGYNAIVDFHDVDDGLSLQPMIIFNPSNALVKTGQKVVSRADMQASANELMKDFSRGKGEGSNKYKKDIVNLLKQLGF